MKFFAILTNLISIGDVKFDYQTNMKQHIANGRWKIFYEIGFNNHFSKLENATECRDGMQPLNNHFRSVILESKH